MGIEQAPTAKGKEAARGLRKAAAEEERKVEARKGSELKKGEKRFEERSRSRTARAPRPSRSRYCQYRHEKPCDLA